MHELVLIKSSKVENNISLQKKFDYYFSLKVRMLAKVVKNYFTKLVLFLERILFFWMQYSHQKGIWVLRVIVHALGDSGTEGKVFWPEFNSLAGVRVFPQLFSLLEQLD